MIDEEGKELRSDKIPTTREGLNEFASTLPRNARVAIEASTLDYSSMNAWRIWE